LKQYGESKVVLQLQIKFSAVFLFLLVDQRKLNRLTLKPLNLKTNEEEHFDDKSFKNGNLRNGQLRLSDTTVCF
jgi:hypothetical protein